MIATLRFAIVARFDRQNESSDTMDDSHLSRSDRPPSVPFLGREPSKQTAGKLLPMLRKQPI